MAKGERQQDDGFQGENYVKMRKKLKLQFELATLTWLIYFSSFNFLKEY